MLVSERGVLGKNELAENLGFPGPQMKKGRTGSWNWEAEKMAGQGGVEGSENGRKGAERVRPQQKRGRIRPKKTE